MTPVQTYDSIIKQALEGRAPKRRVPVTLAMDDPGSGLPIAWAGFYPNRWVAFCDDYLGGGPSYEAWLNKPRGGYEFKNDGHHTRGACITSIELVGGELRLRSRASNWVPTGVLDLKLLRMTWLRLKARRAVWTVEDLNIDPYTVFSYRGFQRLAEKCSSPFLDKALSILHGTPDEQLVKHAPGMLGRHKKAVRRGRQVVQSNEDRIEKAFTFAIPRDFVWLNPQRVREAWVRRVTGERGYGEYQFDHLNYSGLNEVMRRAGSTPSIDELSVRRASRG